MVAGWADIPGLSTCAGCCSAAWLQSWLQPTRTWAIQEPKPHQQLGSRAWEMPSRAATAWRGHARPLAPWESMIVTRAYDWP